MISFSPGIAQGCFDLLGIVSRNKVSFQSIHLSFPYFGSIASAKVVATAQELGWIRAADDGYVAVTASGGHIIKLAAYEAMLRQALLDYINTAQPPWVQNAPFGRARVLSFAGKEIAQVFVEAGLAYGIEETVIAFWDELAARARGVKNHSLMSIGRLGERLSLAYEENRTGRIPKWVAIENNADGYDVLSVIAGDDVRQLSIEVKTSTLGSAGKFHLTRNEWERSLECANHAFHLWDTCISTKPRIAVVHPREMQDHIPSDTGSGVWECVEIPFAAFESRFAVTQA